MGCTGSSSSAANQIPPYTGSHGSSINKPMPLTEKEIQMRIEAPEESRVLTLGGISYHYAWMSQRGYYPESLDKDNQDAYSILPSFGKTADNQAFFAVYDGHGKDGHHCARYAKDHLSRIISEKLDKIPVGNVTSKTIKQALSVAHYLTNEGMHNDKRFDDSLSGTTSISILFRGKTMFVSNVGDSRAIVVSQGDDGRLIAKPMSSDQTPYRKDERERVKKFGARVLSMDQIEGLEPVHENWGDLNLGEDIDEGGDPPRVWSKNGDYPGTAFTRSLGDLLAEECGVIPEPEVLEREVKPSDRYIVIASDGVFEFLTNQMVAEMLARYEDPLEACKAVVAASYNMWLQYEVRTDDITIIALYVNELRQSSNFDSSSSFYAGAGVGAGTVGGALAGGESSKHPAPSLALPPPPPPQSPEIPSPPLNLMEARPVRRVMSREKRKHMIQLKRELDEDEEEIGEGERLSLISAKGEEESEVILSALRSNFLFQHLNPAQRTSVVGLMTAVEVKKGGWIIRQGDAGDRFYIVDTGRFEVRVKSASTAPPSLDDKTLTEEEVRADMTEEERERVGGNVVHIYESGTDQHPGFGELSLMYGKPRAASVIAVTDGKLWALDRRVFRRVVLRPQDYRRDILRTLKKVDLLKSLSLTQMQRLIDLLNEASYLAGEFIIRQGEEGDTFYLLVSGTCECSINSADDSPPKVVMNLAGGSYFGERSLLESKPRAANVVAVSDVKVLYIGKAAFEEVLGPLAQIVNEDRIRREAQAAALLAGPQSLADLQLHGVAVSDALGHVLLASRGAQKDLTVRSFVFADVSRASLSDSASRYIEAVKAVQIHQQEDICVLPKAISMFKQPNALHIAFPTAIVADLSSFIRTHNEKLEQSLDYMVYSFACLTSALERLHDCGVVYRAVQPESVYVDALGKIVLMDFRFSKLGLYGPARAFTICGASDYLSPEQISQVGHSYPVDLWGMGVLLYELAVGAHPFSSFSEVATYSKISSFGTKTFPALKFPDNFSNDTKSLINQLLVPTPEARIGAGANGFASLKKHSFFNAVGDWDAVQKRNESSPLLPFSKLERDSVVAEGIEDKLLDAFAVPFSGDLSWLGSLDV